MVKITKLINKIAYDGMSVGRIGSMTEFSSGSLTQGNTASATKFFKGQLIRLESEGWGQSSEVFNAIYDELLKGVYI